MSKKFKSNTGGHVSIIVDWRSTPIELPAVGDYETSDKAEIQALKDSPEVVEVKEKPKPAKKKVKEEPETEKVTGVKVTVKETTEAKDKKK